MALPPKGAARGYSQEAFAQEAGLRGRANRCEEYVYMSETQAV